MVRYSPHRSPAFLLILLFGQASAAPALAPKDTRPPFCLLPQGVADPDGKIGYVASTRGGIDAVNLATGKLLWATTDPVTPVALHGNRLFVQVADKPNVLHIEALDVTTKGTRLLQSRPINFPDWVSVGLAYGRTFSSSATVAGRQLRLHWVADGYYAGGKQLPKEELKRRSKHGEGVAVMDLVTGEVKMLTTQEAAPKVPDNVRAEFDKLYHDGVQFVKPPLLVGTRFAKPLWETRQGVNYIGLRQWERATGKQVREMELTSGKALCPHLCADGRHLLIVYAGDKSDLQQTRPHFPVFSLESGRELGKVPANANRMTLTVAGPRAFFAETGPSTPGNREYPRTLKAVDLRTGDI